MKTKLTRLAILSVAMLTVVTFAVATERERYTPSTASHIEVSGTSTLHAWKMQGSTIGGAIDLAPEIAANPARADAWKSEKPALVSVTIPVANIKSEHKKMDALMLDAMKAKTYPEIRYELTQATPVKTTAHGFVLHTRGRLTIAGVTHDIEMDVNAVRDGATRYVLAGEAPVTMTSFGLKPPTAMLGTIKTGNDVKVAFRWVVEKAE